MKIEKASIITVDLGNNISNTFVVDTIEDTTLLVSHPLAKGILIRVSKDKADGSMAKIKDSSERGIDFANSNRRYLDFNALLDLDCICTSFVLTKRVTPRQKSIIASICGVVAEVKFNDDLKETMKFITKNSTMLDEFNYLWFTNFRKLFSGDQPVFSKKQRSAIFNIAGFLLAELENPVAYSIK
jgi:hypothetical protein